MTPWQKVFARFELSQVEFAREFGCDKSKISRALSDKAGLINGPDMARLLEMAGERRMQIPQSDFCR